MSLSAKKTKSTPRKSKVKKIEAPQNQKLGRTMRTKTLVDIELDFDSEPEFDGTPVKGRLQVDAEISDDDHPGSLGSDDEY